MALEDAVLSLASLAGQTVVTAAVTDAWGTAKRGFARLLGRGDPARTELAERRLEQTRDQLTGVPASRAGTGAGGAGGYLADAAARPAGGASGGGG